MHPRLATLLKRPWALEQNAFVAMVHAAMKADFASDMGISSKVPIAQRPIWSLSQAVQDALLVAGVDREKPANVAVIPLNGVMTNDEIWAWLMDGTHIPSMQRALEAVGGDPDIQAVVLEVNSGGGEVTGTEQLANTLRDMGKPTVASVGGMAASAAYWVASAADGIVTMRSSMVGSIGVRATVFDWSKFDERVGIKEVVIVSSQSPKKHADVSTQEGRDVIQEEVDALAEVFISAVAENRGVSAEVVIKDFGQGGVLVGESARRAGMTDGINQGGGSAASAAHAASGGNNMQIAVSAITPDWLKAELPKVAELLLQEGAKGVKLPDVAAEVAAAVQGERGRTVEILTDAPEGASAEALELVKTGATADAARKRFLDLAKGAMKTGLAALTGLNGNPVKPNGGDPTDAVAIAAEVKATNDLARKIRGQGATNLRAVK